MIIIQTHQEHIKDLENSIEREKSRLRYLERCQRGEQEWKLSISLLKHEIGLQTGKIIAYQDALEKAKAFALSSQELAV